MAKLLVRHGTILTMEGRRFLRDGYVLVEDGLISSVGGSCEIPPGASDDAVLDARGAVVMPGLVNAHSHAQEYALRDLEERPGEGLETLLRALYRRMSPDLEEDVVREFLLDSLSCGVTTVATAALDVEAVARAAESVGVRVATGPLAGRAGRGLGSEISRLEGLAASSRGRVLPLVFSEAGIPEDLPRDSGLRVVVHMGSGSDLRSILSSGLEPRRILAVYDPEAPGDALAEAAGRGMGFVVCPRAAMRSGADVGRFPLPELSRLGARVAVGCGAALDPDADLLRAAGELARVLQGSRRGGGDAWWALSLVTSSAADALGEASIGRIRPGARGDLVILDPRARGGGPVGGDPHVYAAHRGGCQDVLAVVVDGEVRWKRPRDKYEGGMEGA